VKTHIHCHESVLWETENGDLGEIIFFRKCKAFNCKSKICATFCGTCVLHNLCTQGIDLMEGQFSIDDIYTFWAHSHQQPSNNHIVHRTIIMLDFKCVFCFHVSQTFPLQPWPSPHREFRWAVAHQLYHQPPPAPWVTAQLPVGHLKLIKELNNGDEAFVHHV